jgi:outer membrane protein assembly factor BamA
VNLTGYRIQYGWKRVTDAVVFGEGDDEPDPNYTLGSISFSQTYDTRNNILSPMKGYYLNHEEELASKALLGDVSFARFSAQFTYYKPLREITTEHPFVPFVVFNHRAGIILPYGGTTAVPVPERFFLGGPDTVRGFQLDGLGPRDSGGDPIGGLAMLLFNLEIQWPVFNNIYVAAFTDAGNLWSATQDIQPLDLQVDAGPGLRVYTPLGAIRIDYGYNLNRTEGDPIGAWQVGFGFTF